jgi:hypothetical protein
MSPNDLHGSPGELPPVEAPAPQVSDNRSGLAPLLVGLAILAIAGVGGWFWLQRAAGSAPEISAAAGTEATLHAAPGPTAAPRPEADLEDPRAVARLPVLGQSDSLAREWAARLTGANTNTWAAWFSAPDLLRRLVALVSMMAEGDSPGLLLGALRPAGQWEVLELEDGMLVTDPSTFARYDTLAAAIDSVDVAQAALAWSALRPLLARAWKEIAPPGSRFEDAVGRSLRHLITAPIHDGPLELTQRGAQYAFADPKLEALPAAQKHVLRMGPDNGRLVQQKARKLASALGLPSGR